MFVLADIEDTVRIEPEFLSLEPYEAIQHEIHRKYSNKVRFCEILQDVGLCLCLYDFLNIQEGKVRWGDGCIYHKATFRLAVFRPFPGEVLLGTITSGDKSGLRITMGFFDEIFIPKQFLPTYSFFDHKEGAWFAVFSPSSQAVIDNLSLALPEDRAYLDVGESIRFSVELDEFNDPEPGPIRSESASHASSLPGAASAAMPNAGSADSLPAEHKYTITGSIAGQGLGPVAWWIGAEADVGGDEMMEEG